MTPMLTRIDQELAQATDPDHRAELLAERASYLARLGEFAEANKILAMLRKTYGDGRNARVSVWIMFAEGLILYFEKLSADARDRVLRAHAIARATELVDLAPLTAVWLAHMEFERGAYESMVRLINNVLSSPESIAPNARSRVGMILGGAFMYMGDRPKSQPWFESCHRAALSVGDRAAIGALMYNRAALGLAHLRVRHHAYGESVAPASLKVLEMENASAWAFQVGTGVSSLPHLVDISKARIAILRLQFEYAIDLLLPICQKLVALEDRSNRSSVLADLGFCLMMSGNHAMAKENLELLELSTLDQLDVDDRLCAISMAIETADGLNNIALRQAFYALLSRARKEYESEQASLRSALAKMEHAVPPSGW